MPLQDQATILKLVKIQPRKAQGEILTVWLMANQQIASTVCFTSTTVSRVPERPFPMRKLSTVDTFMAGGMISWTFRSETTIHGRYDVLTLPLSPTLSRELSSGSRTSPPAISMTDSSKSYSYKFRAQGRYSCKFSLPLLPMSESVLSINHVKPVHTPDQPSHRIVHSPRSQLWPTS